MGNLFNTDSPFFVFLGKVADIIAVSFLWVLLCIPIITIGPATTALYYVVVKVIRKERGYIFREFMKSFKLNFKKGAIVGIFNILIFVILVFDIYYAWSWMSIDLNMGLLFLGVFLALTLIVLCITIYLYPILSRFDLSVKQLIKSTVFMSMKHLPYTLILALTTIAAIFIVYAGPVMLFIIPGALTYLNSYIIERVFRKYMQSSNKSDETKVVDEWYLED